MSKVISAEKVAGLINDGATIAWTTAGLCGFAEQVATAIEDRFKETGHPKDLFLTHSCGCGDHKDRGMNHFGHEGMVRKIVSGHIGEAPKLGKLVSENKIEAHLLPQGVMTHLWRQMAGKKIGVITKVGLGTFVDPRHQGGKVSDKTKDEMVKVIELEGEEYLYFKTFPIDVAVIRGTVADENGNMTMDHEPLFLEALSLATAAKNNGGIVIAQVKYVANNGTLHPKKVKVPGVLVDHVVVAEPEHHLQTKVTAYNPAFSGDSRMPLASMKAIPLDERKVIARRAAMELMPSTTLNLGIGMPDGVSNVAAEEGVIDMVTLTTELGNFGGVPAGGPDFPASYNPDCTVDHGYMFDFYDGGGLDACVLGLAQTDSEGNVNVSKFGPKIVGPGGFINISSSAKKVIFVGTMMAGAEYKVENGSISILQEGKIKKFTDEIDHITFSGKYAALEGRDIVYVTERAVFKLSKDGLVLTEIAPGLDFEKDIIPAMGFRPLVAEDLKEMPKEIFEPKWGKLKQIMEAKK